MNMLDLRVWDNFLSVEVCRRQAIGLRHDMVCKKRITRAMTVPYRDLPEARILVEEALAKFEGGQWVLYEDGACGPVRYHVYAPGERVDWHMDGWETNTEGYYYHDAEEVWLYSLLIYLTTCTRGSGATEFYEDNDVERCGASVLPRVGRAVVFPDCMIHRALPAPDSDSAGDKVILHATIKRRGVAARSESSESW